MYATHLRIAYTKGKEEKKIKSRLKNGTKKQQNDNNTQLWEKKCPHH